MASPLRDPTQPLPGLPCPKNKNGIQCGAKRIRSPGDQTGCRIVCPNKDCGAMFTLTEDEWKRDARAEVR